MTSLEFLMPLALFATVATMTPGPNNLMLMASGANFGLRATLPHMAGVSVGFPVMLMAVGLGLGTVFERYPLLHDLLRWAGTAYLLWFAWRVATAAGTGRAEGRGRPLSFLEAAGFQWVNPKAWMMAISAFAVYSVGDAASPVTQSLLFGAVFAAIAAPSVTVWAAFGSAIGRLLGSGRTLRAFNLAMASLLAASVALLFV